MQPTLSLAAELQALLVRYDCGAMPPGVAARVSILREMLEIQFGADDPILLMTVDIDRLAEDEWRELSSSANGRLAVCASRSSEKGKQRAPQ